MLLLMHVMVSSTARLFVFFPGYRGFFFFFFFLGTGDLPILRQQEATVCTPDEPDLCQNSSLDTVHLSDQS